MTHQKAISQPVVQEYHKVGNEIYRLVVDGELVSKRSRRYEAVDARELSVIDVGNRLKVEARRDVHGHKREHGRSVSHQWPLGAPLRAIYGIEQRVHALEKHNDDDAWNGGWVRTGRWTHIPTYHRISRR